MITSNLSSRTVKLKYGLALRNGLFNRGNKLGDIISEKKNKPLYNDIRSINEDIDGNIHIVMGSGVKIIKDGILQQYMS